MTKQSTIDKMAQYFNQQLSIEKGNMQVAIRHGDMMGYATAFSKHQAWVKAAIGMGWAHEQGGTEVSDDVAKFLSNAGEA